MYAVNNKKIKSKKSIINNSELLNITGFLMGSNNKVYKIEGSNIAHIKVVNKTLANPIVSNKVLKKYNQLIIKLTNLLVDDDESGESFREALNQIEKFRQIIKNKYRAYLKQKDLEKMSKQLKTLQKEAETRLIEIQEQYLEITSSHRQSK